MNEIKQTTPAILEKPRNDASEALLFSTLLTVIGGFFESYSYVARGTMSLPMVRLATWPNWA